ncbi:MAG: hypothetical protein P4L64_13145 [Caulobacteraceae bacterium]|nr:hypothetical protein [Caulobacteraceae bacterium]
MMISDLLDQLRTEEAALQRKLDAVRAVIAAYSSEGTTPSVTYQAAKSKDHDGHGNAPKGQMPLERFSEYGQTILLAAMDVIRGRPGAPVPIRDLVSGIQAKGYEIRGRDPANALSALLARCSAVTNEGRRGWLLAESDPSGVGSASNEAAYDAELMEMLS